MNACDVIVIAQMTASRRSVRRRAAVQESTHFVPRVHICVTPLQKNVTATLRIMSTAASAQKPVANVRRSAGAC